MNGKVLVGILLGLMLLGVSNMAFSEEQTKPQAQERFVLKDIQPAGDESNGRVPLMGDDSESDMDGFTTEGSWIPIASQPVQSFDTFDWKQVKIIGVAYFVYIGEGNLSYGRLAFFLPKGKDFYRVSHLEKAALKGVYIFPACSGYRFELIAKLSGLRGGASYVSPLWFGHDVEHVIQRKLTLLGHTFKTDRAYPLTFKLIKERGYVYLCGHGTVTTPDGKTHRLGEADTVDTWLPRLKSEDLLDRESAAQALGYLAKTKEEKDKAVPALIEALDDKTMEVRRNAAEALGRLRDERATEALVPLLKDKEAEWWVADVAAESLCRIGKKLNPETVAQIATSLKSDETMERACAAQALGVGGMAAVEPLIGALADKEASVKAAAVQSLIAIGEGMGEALKAVQEDEVRRSISDWALRLEMNRDNMLKFFNDALQETDKNVRTWSAQKLGEIGDKQAVNPLKEALAKEQDLETKKAMEEAMGKLEKFE
ncbi:HEAT repeat domain-containing protein [Candidatus Poribacteria bacterium]|nr:HEAT repeat domain-containing protein [Candidatus Poribacteria bacterium]